MHLSSQHFAEVVEALRHGRVGGGHERRQITRLEVQTRLQIARYRDGVCAEELNVLSRDISIGGIGLLQSVGMENGEQVVVCLPRLERPPLFVLSVVTYCRQMADGLFGLGIQFQRLMSLDPDQTRKIDQVRQSILG